MKKMIKQKDLETLWIESCDKIKSEMPRYAGIATRLKNCVLRTDDYPKIQIVVVNELLYQDTVEVIPFLAEEVRNRMNNISISFDVCIENILSSETKKQIRFSGSNNIPEFVKRGLQRLQDIEKLLNASFFSALSDEQEKYNNILRREIMIREEDIQNYIDAESNLALIADYMNFYRKCIKDLQRILLREISPEMAERRVFDRLLYKVHILQEIAHQQPQIIDGVPHYKVYIGNSDDNPETLMELAAERAEIIMHYLDYSAGKASVAFWTNGVPELIYISTFTLDGEGYIEEKRDMSSSTI